MEHDGARERQELLSLAEPGFEQPIDFIGDQPRHRFAASFQGQLTGAFLAIWCSAYRGDDPPYFNHPLKEDIIAAQRTRVNEQIRISPVRLIDAEGEQLGVVPLEVARENAKEQGLDLVEVAANARPPVVRMMDWGRFQYEEQKRAKESKRRQHTVEVKEVKLRPQTDVHDMDVKLRHARRFLKAGKKVKVTVRYRGREMRRPELGFEVLEKVAESLDDLANIESRSGHIESRQLTMMLAPE